jgi:hypothetical protein
MYSSIQKKGRYKKAQNISISLKLHFIHNLYMCLHSIDYDEKQVGAPTVPSVVIRGSN